MIQILVTRDFDGQGEESRAITYMVTGYSLTDYTDTPIRIYDVEIEESFIGASMFGWDAPVANPAHRWVSDLREES